MDVSGLQPFLGRCPRFDIAGLQPVGEA